MRQTQLIKGVLEGCVLATLAEHESYGYELIQALRQDGFDTLVGGTLYPLLVKLENHGELKSELKASPEVPDRKYYALTTQGYQALQDFDTQWFQLKSNVDQILTRGNYHDQD